MGEVKGYENRKSNVASLGRRLKLHLLVYIIDSDQDHSLLDPQLSMLKLNVCLFIIVKIMTSDKMVMIVSTQLNLFLGEINDIISLWTYTICTQPIAHQ